MDSLLATYASSDEEEDQQQSHQHQNPKQNQSKFFSSLPPPKAPQQTLTPTNPSPSKPNKSSHPESRSDSKSSSASLFSRLPQPKSERSDPFSLDPKPKKIVQFRPPIIPKIEDDDDEEDDYKEKQRIKDEFIPQAPSVKSFLSSIPAPRNSGSLGALPSASGTGRRSILDAEVPGLCNSNAVANKAIDNQVKSESTSVNLSGESYVNYDNTYNGYANVGSNESADVAATTADYGSYDYSNYENVDTNYLSYGPAPPASGDHGNYSGYEGYSDYGNHGQYVSKWIDRSSGDLAPEISEPTVQNVVRASGKRGRNEIPQDVIEVSQDELMKNRPREDQVKMTGIAFGPAYQPASSAKGKPTKLHKRKHQIGSLYFDMRSKEMELAERRSKGFLTKAETQAKYGW